MREKMKAYRMLLPDGRRPPIGVGCAWIGKLDPDGKPTKEGVDLLLRTYEKGLRFFDTSREYGESELVVGEFLKQVPRNDIFLATKADFRSGHDDFEQFKVWFFESFERLGVDHIDCYHIHDCRLYEPCVPEIIPFLLEQREKGLISYVGMGTYSLNTLELATRSGWFDSILSFANYSLIKKSASYLIDLANTLNVAFQNASVFHFGIIKHHDPAALRQPPPSYLVHYCELAAKMHELCDSIGVDITAASIQFSLLNPGIDMLLNGIKRLDNLESTMRALETPIHADQWGRIFELQEQDQYLHVQEGIFE
jgi:aryl-alcohol dehydrogenase-like predicted oxidoreductase